MNINLYLNFDYFVKKTLTKHSDEDEKELQND